MGHVPDRFIPNGEVYLGDFVGVGPPIDFDEIELDPGPDCPLCGGPIVRLEVSGEDYCIDCDTRSPRSEEQELRRLGRLREAHNDGNFMPKSVSEWHGERGGRQ